MEVSITFLTNEVNLAYVETSLRTILKGKEGPKIDQYNI